VSEPCFAKSGAFGTGCGDGHGLKVRNWFWTLAFGGHWSWRIHAWVYIPRRVCAFSCSIRLGMYTQTVVNTSEAESYPVCSRFPAEGVKVYALPTSARLRWHSKALIIVESFH